MRQEKSEIFSRFPERLKNLRFRLRLTQPEMGARLGVSGQYVYQIESGKKPPTIKLLGKVEELERAGGGVSTRETQAGPGNYPEPRDEGHRLNERQASRLDELKTAAASVIAGFDAGNNLDDLEMAAGMMEALKNKQANSALTPGQRLASRAGREKPPDDRD